MTAGHCGLDSLTLIVDRNGLQQGDRTEDTNRLDPLAERFAGVRLGDARGRRSRPSTRCSTRLTAGPFATGQAELPHRPHASRARA